MKFTKRFTFIREFRDTEDRVELFDNEKKVTILLTYKQYHMYKGYYDNVNYIDWKAGEL